MMWRSESVPVCCIIIHRLKCTLRMRSPSTRAFGPPIACDRMRPRPWKECRKAMLALPGARFLHDRRTEISIVRGSPIFSIMPGGNVRSGGVGWSSASKSMHKSGMVAALIRPKA